MFWSYTVKDVVEVEPMYFPPYPPSRSPLGSLESLGVYEEGCAAPASSSSAFFASIPPVSGAVVGEGAETTIKPIVAPALSRWSDIVLHRLTERYVGRVVPRLGLCVAVEHVLEYTPCSVRGPHGSAWLGAVFDICVFAPAPGTRLRAKISSQNDTGIYLRVDFAAAFPIHVPAAQLVDGSLFDAERKQWCLPLQDEGEGESGEGGGEEYRNYYTVNEDVVVKMLSCDVCGGEGEHSQPEAALLMRLVGSFQGDGLGPVVWYDEN